MREAMRLPPESSTTGDGDALDQLEREHREVEQLFARASLLHGDARIAVLGPIVRALSTHAAVEEQVVYPAIAEVVGGGDMLADRAREEHQEIKDLLQRLDKASVDDASVIADLRSLQLVVQAHVAVEEGELFPAYRAAATPDQRRDLTTAADDARSAAPTHPHPHAPNTPPGNVIIGAVAGVVDRVRDVVSGRNQDLARSK